MTHPQDASLAIGLDLGTTNGLISVWQHGEARLIPNALNENFTPSAVSMDEKRPCFSIY
ncbi:Hsp70 family protein [Pectobacterium aquaticum]|uniref:Hsp70 family protein n=1 Tax=Pectobacterium aquaticum TaxID=2204145 RepID=UPI0026D43532|nr:molecular chaperone HscC [Pseudomonadota bacterium]